MPDRLDIAQGLDFELGHQHAQHHCMPAAIVAADLARAQDLPDGRSWSRESGETVRGKRHDG